MASCSKCGKNVGCGCNLVAGYCMACYSELNGSNEPLPEVQRTFNSRRTIYTPTVSEQPNTEFDLVLKDDTITKEEKVKRINDILEKARLNQK